MSKRKIRIALKSDICECTHVRTDHTITTRGTDGSCLYKNCICNGFYLKSTPTPKTTKKEKVSRTGRINASTPIRADAPKLRKAYQVAGIKNRQGTISSGQGMTATVVFPPESVIREAMDQVNHPQHYGGDTTYEVIKVLEAWGLDKSFCLGNAVKYIARHDKKERSLEDLKKAAWYLNREIVNREKQQ